VALQHGIRDLCILKLAFAAQENQLFFLLVGACFRNTRVKRTPRNCMAEALSECVDGSASAFTVWAHAQL
jgi:hypothetical protein